MESCLHKELKLISWQWMAAPTNPHGYIRVSYMCPICRRVIAWNVVGRKACNDFVKENSQKMQGL